MASETESNPLERARALFNEGLALLTRARYAGAEHKLREALVLAPDRVSILTNLSAALLRQDKFAESAKYAERSVQLDARNAPGWLNLGICLERTGDPVAALEHYDRAITLTPDYAESHFNRGGVLRALYRHEDALASYDRAIALDAGYADAWSDRGVTLKALGRPDDALACHDRAVSLAPTSAEAWSKRGVALHELKRLEDALASFDRALALGPPPYVLGDRLRVRMELCDWDGFEAACDEVLRGVGAGERISNPFHLLSIHSTPAQQRRCAEIYVQDKYPASARVLPFGKRSPRERLRIGYFSADFHGHATAYLMAGLFECHDRSKFEIVGFSFGPSDNGPMRKRLELAFDRFVDVRARSDREIAALARDAEITIAVDLKGLTAEARPGIFAMRAAPVQVNYLGYPGTTGAEYIDYLIADRTVVPPQHARDYAETIVYLPHSYQVNDSKREISGEMPTRRDAGLPEGFVFCCFNNSAKITPDVFDVWMRLLNTVEGSVLWLLEDHSGTVANLRKEAVARGVAADRLVFARRTDAPRHLARHRLADLFLDTWYYNAHTTASDALWAGLPVLTCLGDAFAGRVAASLLNATGLPELVARSREHYEALALALARDPDRLTLLKETLARNRAAQPLFDTALFTRNIESAYTAMWERYRAESPP